jgi:pimeloyl-ACP methyl ester carboxylesterase
MSVTPSLAAKLANGVYGIREMDDIESVAEGFARRQVTDLDGEFDLETATIVQGVTGGRVLNARSGFAVVIPGAGSRRGEAAVAVRGTVTGYDWLTNISAAVAQGPGGSMVHAGFNRVTDHIIRPVHAALDLIGPSHIHVVGHSLGGAVATLTAAHLKGRYGADVELYSFGAPRAGLDAFSERLTADLRLPVKRVSNPSDIVPMVPIHPYRHVPRPGEGISVRTNHGVLSIDAHFMSSYGPAVKDRSWDQLLSASREQQAAMSVDRWLDFAAQHSVIPGSSLALHALAYALRGVIALAERTFGLTLVGGLTLLDGLAWLLERAARLTVAIGERVLALMRTILRFAGVVSVEATDLSARFIRFVLGLLLRPLGQVARRAFARIEQGAA